MLVALVVDEVGTVRWGVAVREPAHVLDPYPDGHMTMFPPWLDAAGGRVSDRPNGYRHRDAVGARQRECLPEGGPQPRTTRFRVALGGALRAAADHQDRCQEDLRPVGAHDPSPDLLDRRSRCHTPHGLAQASRQLPKGLSAQKVQPSAARRGPAAGTQGRMKSSSRSTPRRSTGRRVTSAARTIYPTGVWLPAARSAKEDRCPGTSTTRT